MANLFPSTCCCTEDSTCDCTLDVKYIETIDLLKLISIVLGQYVYYALGSSTKGDGGGGVFYWDPDSIATADDINVVQATGVNTGRWIRIGSSSESYAEIYVAGASAPQSIATGAAYTKCTAFTTNGESINCTADAANDKITITDAGVYKCDLNVSFTSETDSLTYDGAIFINGVTQSEIHFSRKLATGADSTHVSTSGLLTVATVPVDLDFRWKHNDGGAVNITVSHANINIHKIGEA